ncbi:MAG: SpoIID/LytB domain-containing protein [Planctomycetes bacterium]|nr:SpoIID/LytB domain-containing protein [Planctomycetota bacterium]
MALTLHRPAAFAKTALGACIVYAVLTAGGCARREPIQPTFGMSEPSDSWMRVLLFHNRTECAVSAPGGFGVRDENDTVQVRFPDTSEPIRICAEGDRISVAGLFLDGAVILETAEPFVFFIDGQGYRGNLSLRVCEPNSLQAVNVVPIEAYLAGVVGAEMHSYWEPQALQAQSVAARTYALYMKNRFGKERDWDVTTTQANQVYRGLAAETATVRSAVEQTRGMILVCPAVGGEREIFPAYYSSTCGGHTEDSQAVFGESFAALRAVECPWCRAIAKSSFWNWGPVEYSIEEIHRKLTGRYPSLAEKLGKVTAVEIVRTGSLNRVTGVSILGGNGKKDFLRGEDFRLALDPSGMKLKSTIFSLRREGIVYVFLDGHGFGHGVGLCQTGAEYLAREGRTYREILSWYYPGSEIVRLAESK